MLGSVLRNEDALGLPPHKWLCYSQHVLVAPFEAMPPADVNSAESMEDAPYLRVRNLRLLWSFRGAARTILTVFGTKSLNSNPVRESCSQN